MLGIKLSCALFNVKENAIINSSSTAGWNHLRITGPFQFKATQISTADVFKLKGIICVS